MTSLPRPFPPGTPAHRPAGDRYRVNIRFTLIELLVVIAIISVLAAMLLPALAKSRTMARRMVNMTNHRQTVICLMLYADDNGEYVPYSNPLPANVSTNFRAAPYSWDPDTLVDPLRRYGFLTEFLRGPTTNDQPIGLDTIVPGKLVPLNATPVNHSGDWGSSIMYWPGKNIAKSDPGEGDYSAGEWGDSKPYPVPGTRAFVDPGKIVLSDATIVGVAGTWSFITHSSDRVSWIHPTLPSTATATSTILGNHRTYADGHVAWVTPREMGKNNTPVVPNLLQARYGHFQLSTRAFWF